MDGIPKLKLQTTSDEVSSQTLQGIGRPDDFVLGLTFAEYEALIAWLCKCRCLRLQLGNRRLLHRCPRSRRLEQCRHAARSSGETPSFG